MESSQKLKRLRIAIVVLSVLLAIILSALAVTLTRSSALRDPVTTNIPNNFITPEAGAVEMEPDQPLSQSVLPDQRNLEQNQIHLILTSMAVTPAHMTPTATVLAANRTSTSRNETTIELYNRQADDNSPFQVTNMLPGDAETKNYIVRVSHSGNVTVHYHADIREGYEKLAEVLKVKIRLLTTGEILYDGLMRDMPVSLDHTLSATSSTTSNLDYEITAYLDTSVGNEYQNKSLIADFRWWVEGEEQGNLEPPKTGDDSHLILWVVIGIAALAVVVFLLIWQRKEARKHERE